MSNSIGSFSKKNYNKRGVKALVLVMLMVIQLLGTVQIVSANDFDLSIMSYNMYKNGNLVDIVYEDDSFNLLVSYKNTSASNWTDLRISVKQTAAFYVPNGISQYNETAININDTKSVSIPLKYNGGGSSVGLDFYYSTDGGATYSATAITKTIYLNTQDSSSSQPSTPTDTTKYKPAIESIFDNSQMLTLEAGKLNTWKFSLKNDSNYAAKDVKISIKYDDKLKDFIEVNQTKQEPITVEKIDTKKSVEIECPIKLDRATIEGQYSITLEYSYKNTWNDAYSGKETISFKLVNPKSQSKLTIESISFDKESVKVGEDATLMIKIKNSGDLKAKQVKATLTSIGAGFTLHNSTQIKERPYILGTTTETFKFPIIALESAKTGNVQVDFTIEYLDESGVKSEIKNTAFVYLEIIKEEEKSNAEVKIKNLVAPEGTLTTGKGYNVTFDVVNEGSTDAKKLKIQINGDSSIMSKSMNPIVIEELKAGESKAVSFAYYITPNAPDKYYSFGINLDYQKNSESTSSFSTTQSFGFEVASASNIQSTPKIIVENYSFDKEVVKAGEEFELRLSLYNTSKSSSVNNIKISLTSSGEFIPVNGSNSIYVDYIPIQDKKEAIIKLFPKADLLSKFYQITLKMEYEGEGELLKNPNDSTSKGSQYMEEEIISIQVYQEPRLKVQEPAMPPFAMVGQPVNLEAEFFNVGKSEIFNLEVKVEGEFQGQDMNYVVGNFAQGRSDYFSAQIIPMKEGENKGSLVFFYEDDLGKPLEYRKEFVINVQAMEGFNPEMGGNEMEVFKEGINGEFMGEMNGMPGMGGMGGNPKILGIFNSIVSLIIVVVIIIAIVVVTIVIIKKRAKKKRGMTEDEEY